MQDPSSWTPSVSQNDLFRTELLDRRQRLDRALRAGQSDRRLLDLLSQVDAALDRVERGSYGLCETCHEPIERDRLAADPLIRYCLDHLSYDEQRALEQDLHLAAQIQQGLLPPATLQARGWEMARHFAPFGPVSGDYCDVVLPEGGLQDVYFLLGDVSGKGVAAALLMANLHATFRTLLGTGLAVEALMERANRLFCESTMASHYATLVCVKASPDGSLAISNAGHCPVLLRTKDAVRVVPSGGLPLGMFCSARSTTDLVRLDAGDVMLLYSDGLIEARNDEDEEYGQDRLTTFFECLEEGRCRDAGLLTKACLDDLARFSNGRRPSDDLTIMAVRRLMP